MDDDRRHHREGAHGSFTASNKVYDGNTAATIARRSLTGIGRQRRCQPDGGNGSFDTAEVGTGKTVTAPDSRSPALTPATTRSSAGRTDDDRRTSRPSR